MRLVGRITRSHRSKSGPATNNNNRDLEVILGPCFILYLFNTQRYTQQQTFIPGHLLCFPGINKKTPKSVSRNRVFKFLVTFLI
jgi:hypothetical protein